MDPLADPDSDRAMKEIVPPPHRPIADDLLYPNKSKEPSYHNILIASNAPNWELLKTHMYKEGRVSKEHC